MVSVKELLEDAQQEAWDLARDRPTDRNRHEVVLAKSTWPIVHAHTQAWPGLAAASARSLKVLSDRLSQPGRGPTRDALTDLHRTLDRVRAMADAPQRSGPEGTGRGVEPDARLVRIGRLVGAVGDVVGGSQVGHVPLTADEREDLARLQARVLGVMETCARSTRGYLEEVGTGPGGVRSRRAVFEQLQQHISRVIAYTPGQRDGRYDDLAVYAASEDTTAAHVHRWVTAARAALTDPRCSSDSVGRVAADAALLLGGTRALLQSAAVHELVTRQSSTRPDPVVAAAQQAWVQAARSWTVSTTRAGVFDVEFQDASRALRRHVNTTLRPDGRWHVPSDVRAVPEAGRDARQVLASVDEVGRLYRDVTRKWVHGEQLVVPARRLERAALVDRPDHAAAVRTGRWVPLPPTTGAAQGIERAGAEASAAVARAREAAGPAHHRYIHPFERGPHASPASAVGRTREPDTPGVER